MSKTGGGRGSNHYSIRGVGKIAAAPAPGREPEVVLSTTISDGTHWDNLLAQFPSYPGDVLAVPEPAWDDLSDLVARIAPKGRDRAVARYLACESRALFNDARLEGFAYTEPEIATLINGGHVAGHTLGEEAQVAGMKAASDLMLRRVEDGPLEPTKALSDDLHLQVALSLGLKSLAFRGDQRKQYAGPLVTLDYGERFRALDARVTPAVLDSGLRRIKQLDHPVLRAVTWAAFATYSQFYLEGNRRAGRYVMNAVVMSHGFDAILIPDRLKAEYQDALVESYRSGNVTSHIRFLLELYNDQ